MAPPTPWPAEEKEKNLSNPAVRKGERNHAAADVGAWAFNVTSSVLIVFVNKLLMDPRSGFGFVFATTLCSLHFFSAAITIKTAEFAQLSKPASLPWMDTLAFSAMAAISIGSLNLSLLINTVGFYQIAKLLIIPFVCVVELVYMRRKFNTPTTLSILTVVAGVAVVTVNDLAVGQIGVLGLVVAGVSVVSSGMQQIMCGNIQRKQALTSMQMLSNTAPVQGLMLLVVGPFLDAQITGKWVLDFHAAPAPMWWLAFSCAVSVLVNISQFMCLGRFSAVTFQVLGHTKTVLVLSMGWLFLNEVMTLRKLGGMALAVAGMVGYGVFSNKK
ncbi:hypothetical protein FOA52_003494 [Chlamydomonas sp. UWO 241]|nr:hypothetical protein FOA52_003494 [Chlamydomonas sp. UWO 241]